MVGVGGPRRERREARAAGETPPCGSGARLGGVTQPPRKDPPLQLSESPRRNPLQRTQGWKAEGGWESDEGSGRARGPGCWAQTGTSHSTDKDVLSIYCVPTVCQVWEGAINKRCALYPPRAHGHTHRDKACRIQPKLSRRTLCPYCCCFLCQSRAFWLFLPPEDFPTCSARPCSKGLPCEKASLLSPI